MYERHPINRLSNQELVLSRTLNSINVVHECEKRTMVTFFDQNGRKNDWLVSEIIIEGTIFR